MCPSEMDDLEKVAMDLYTLLGAQMNNAGVKFGEDLPPGYQITDVSGQAFVPSPFGMESILDCAQRVFESWTESGKQPELKDLHSWFASMGALQEERISTLLSAVTMTALRLSIASGDVSTVLRVLQNLFPTKEQNSTAQSTSSKNKTASGNGTSSAPRPRGRKDSSLDRTDRIRRKKNPSGSRNPDDPGGNSTVPKKLRKTNQKQAKK